MVSKYTANRIAVLLDRSNGNRRERTLSLGDVWRHVTTLRNQGFWFTDGGRVSNSYKYPAVTTVFVVVRHRGHLWVKSGVVSANGTGTGVGDVIRGDTWVGPTTSAGLEQIGFERVS